MLYLSNFNVSEAACTLLTVAADEGHGAAVFKQFSAVEDLPGLNAKKSCYVVYVYIFHSDTNIVIFLCSGNEKHVFGVFCAVGCPNRRHSSPAKSP